MQEPVSIVLGTELCRRSQSGITVLKEEMYYVPLMKSLQQLLTNKHILNEVLLLKVIFMYIMYMCLMHRLRKATKKLAIY